MLGVATPSGAVQLVLVAVCAAVLNRAAVGCVMLRVLVLLHPKASVMV